jgi:cysteine desulfurase / selenocysteine lyase
MLVDGPEDNWELGARDAGAYTTLSEVVGYFEWLGSQLTDDTDRRAKFIAAGHAICSHETGLTYAMINGTGNLRGLAEMENVNIIGGADNPVREGLVALYVDGIASADVVSALNSQGIRTHLRKADHYLGNILNQLGLDGCVRVSMCHYNSEHEIAQFLTAMKEIAALNSGGVA